MDKTLRLVKASAPVAYVDGPGSITRALWLSGRGVDLLTGMMNRIDGDMLAQFTGPAYTS